LVSLGADAYQEGAVARLGALAPEPSLRQFPRFAHVRTATQGSVSFFPFWLIKERYTVMYVKFLIDKFCCTLFGFQSDSE
jgi:hypothetical protein